MHNLMISLLLAACLTGAGVAGAAAEWQPAESPLMSPWGEQVDPQNVLPDYPRPQLRRGEGSWIHLNGLWNYSVRHYMDDMPSEWDGQILVPFAIESALSGVKKPLMPDEQLWYRRDFEVPEAWDGKRIVLHFGAVDWEATVYVNGQQVATHRGGNLPFSFEVTQALKENGPQRLTVAVWDPTNTGFSSVGKQVLEPGGILYTAVSGIWQTVWLEATPQVAVTDVKLTPDVDNKWVTVEVNATNPGPNDHAAMQVMDGDAVVASKRFALNHPIDITLPDPKLWSPDSPHLYDVQIRVGEDEVWSYFGMRKIEVKPDEEGINRLWLNNEPLFQYGLLDQGWWPGGLLTAPSDEALKYDIEKTLDWGYNMIRKHVKIEPARWYYWCDKLGVLVWQDQPSIGGPSHGGIAQHRRQYEGEIKDMIDTLHNHPSIVMWVPFNEGWSQYDTERITKWIMDYDPSRLVNNASGWTDHGVGDVLDHHTYPGPGLPVIEEDRAFVQGEFGGLGLPVEGHLWRQNDNWGYRTYETREELQSHYKDLMLNLLATIPQGMAAAVYTQTTDVEGEVNGIVTYDRKVIKFDEAWLNKIHQLLYRDDLELEVLMPTSARSGQIWNYTTREPGEGWIQPDFDDTNWQVGDGMFGTEGTPNTKIGTTWDTSDIWLRKQFEIKEIPTGVYFLQIRHDEDVQVYLNGKEVAALEGHNSQYAMVPLGEEGRNSLHTGTNTIAVHCSQEEGGQAIDVGLVMMSVDASFREVLTGN